MADRRRGRGDDVDEFLVVDLAGGLILARLPDQRARAHQLAVLDVIEHRPAGEHDRRRVDGRRGHQAGRRGLVAAGHQHHAVERITVEHFDQAEISEVAVERRGRPLAGLLDGMHRELERDAAGVADAGAHALRQLDVVPVARAQVGAGLRNADDRTARRQFLAGEAEIEIALQIERGHARIIRIVEPQLRAQPLLPVRFAVLRHAPSPAIIPARLSMPAMRIPQCRDSCSVDIASLCRRDPARDAHKRERDRRAAQSVVTKQ